MSHIKGQEGGGGYKGHRRHKRRPPDGGLHTQPVQSSDQNMYIIPHMYGPDVVYESILELVQCDVFDFFTKFVFIVFFCSSLYTTNYEGSLTGPCG